MGCNFENEDLCGWQIFPAPPDFPFEWERTNGKTLDEQGIAGPKHDHAEQPQSYFMFANAARDHEQAEEAVMASPVISGAQFPNFCFEFYSDLKPHEGISALQVSIENVEGDGDEVLIWQLTNIQLDFW